MRLMNKVGVITSRMAKVPITARTRHGVPLLGRDAGVGIDGCRITM